MSARESSLGPAWALSGGNPQRTGLFGGPVELPHEPDLRLQMPSSIQAPVIIDTVGRAFVADMAGTVCAFAPDGCLLWRTIVDAGVVAAPGLEPGTDRLFVATVAGSVYSLDGKSGAQLWRSLLPSSSDPRVLADLLVLSQLRRVVASSWGGYFHSLSVETGQSLVTWRAGVSPRAAASAGGDGHVYCIRALPREEVQLLRVDSSGTESVVHAYRPRVRGSGRALVAAAPVIDLQRDRVYAILNEDQEGCLCAFGLTDARLLWRHRLGRAVSATPALGPDGTILVADMEGCLRAIAPDGSMGWVVSSDSEYLLAAPVCDGRGCVTWATPTGILYQTGPDRASRPWFRAARSLQAQPSLAGNGDLYVPCTSGHVFVFGNRARRSG